ncbi:uncharacterized protein LOC6572574 [Drosophila mojavensis]|uniref:Uncharacterized protein, isoform A n=1 Tax=Drosophila mojavensis TaxID=7230 RepID=B4K692_DROMO|nr:uncharacterized protein LOC6572574 [Drosophila mojavensis]EDW14142.1 uncharacterized protein Dmoj_GI23499, isoform A [Drosophila mojavensis]KRG00896.1 uncharacterized protein Dmoj_GI23499, isoform B [Drosophila mojavensis]
MERGEDETKPSRGSRLRSKLVNCIEAVLQNALFFLVMGTLCALMIFTLIIAIEDVARLRQMRHSGLRMLPKTNDNLEHVPPCRCHWPSAWCRLFANCDTKIMHLRQLPHSREHTTESIPGKQLPMARPDSTMFGKQMSHQIDEPLELENPLQT